MTASEAMAMAVLEECPYHAESKCPLQLRRNEYVLNRAKFMYKLTPDEAAELMAMHMRCKARNKKDLADLYKIITT